MGKRYRPVWLQYELVWLMGVNQALKAFKGGCRPGNDWPFGQVQTPNEDVTVIWSRPEELQ